MNNKHDNKYNIYMYKFKTNHLFYIYFQINDIDFNKLGNETDGFSGSDIKEGCRQAALFRVHEVLQAHRNLHGIDAL